MRESGAEKEELRRLRRRVADLEEEREIARRLAAFDDGPAGRGRIYRFVRWESGNFSVARLCQVCGVARSAYYDWLGRQNGLVAQISLNVGCEFRGRAVSPRPFLLEGLQRDRVQIAT